MKKLLIMQAAFIGIFLLGVSGCTQSPSSPAEGGSTVVFKTSVDNSSSGTSSHNSIPSSGTSVDSIEVTSAGFFVSNMLFFSNSTGDETDANRTQTILRDDHFILDFESWGKQYIGDRVITASTYRSIRFTMKPAEGSTDSLSVAFGSLFNTFFRSAAGSTVVIKGNLWKNSIKMPFEYRTQLTGNELAQFDNAFTVVPGDVPKEVDVQFKTSAAFSNGARGLIDPRDSRNAAGIDANLKSSLKALQNNSGS